MRKFHFIWEFLEGNRKRMAAMIILVCVYAFLNLCSPLLFSFMIDNVIHAQPANNSVLAWLLDHLGGAAYLQRNLWIGAAAILAINALICVCVFLRGYWNAVISEEVCRKVRNRLYAHLQSCRSVTTCGLRPAIWCSGAQAMSIRSGAFWRDRSQRSSIPLRRRWPRC